MQTQCPDCKAIFRVSPKQLQAANGWVRCGQCHAVFSGREQVSFLKPEELELITRRVYDDDHTLTKTQDADETSSPDVEKAEEITSTELDETSEPAPLTKSNDVRPEQRFSESDSQFPDEGVPAILRNDFTSPEDARKHGRNSRIVTGLFSFMLLMLLAGQYIYFHWWELSRNPQLYPTLRQLCTTVGCNLAPLRNVERIELVSRNVYSHPNEPDALMITATIANNALFAQPYPTLQISFINQQEKVIASRQISPREYLPKTKVSNALMPSGGAVSFSVEVVDPGKDAFGYEFEFF